TQDKESDDDATDEAEILAQIADSIPERTTHVGLALHDTQHLDGTYYQRDQHRDKGNVHIVVEFAYRFDEGPTIGTKHENAIRGIQQAHASGEQGGEDQNRPDR